MSLEKALFGAGVSHERHLLRYPAEIASVFSQTGLRLETAFVITWMCFGTVRKACFYIYICIYDSMNWLSSVHASPDIINPITQATWQKTHWHFTSKNPVSSPWFFLSGHACWQLRFADEDPNTESLPWLRGLVERYGCADPYAATAPWLL